jgi:hypothetical protein
MSSENDVDRFVKDPSLLIELCREVIDRIDSGSDDPKAGEKEAQLRVIANAIDKLGKQGIAVPEALRAEKTRLAAQLGLHAEAEQALRHFADELDAVLKDLNCRLGRGSDKPTTKQQRLKHSRSPKTDKKTLRKNIIKALRTLGGRAKVTDVIEEMGRQLDSKLLPGDLEWRESTNEYAWQNNAKWERYTFL